jgi:hypothetical protein
MAVSIVPALIDAIVTQATAALSDVLVLDGFGVSDAPAPDLLMVGVDDGESTVAATSTAVSQTMATLGTARSRDQQGQVWCWAYSWNGNTDQKAARDSVYTTFEAVADLCRTDPTFGVGLPGRVVCQIGDENLSQDQDESGAKALLIFSVNFTARI